MAGDIPLQNWQAAGLLKASVIKPVITTIEPTLILKKLGRLQEGYRFALKQTLGKIIG